MPDARPVCIELSGDERECATCGDRGWVVEGHLSDGTASQEPCPDCDEYEVTKRVAALGQDGR